MTTPAPIKEAQVMRACIAWLEWHGYEHWRMPISPVMRGGGKQAIRFGRNPLKGFPDLCGVLKKRRGVMWACECKTATGKLSPEQVDWIQRLKRAGVAAFVARTPEQMAAMLLLAEEGR